MRHLIIAICCAAAAALVPAVAQSQSALRDQQPTFYQRPPPATEPSVVIAESPSAVKPKVEIPIPKPVAPKPVVRPKPVHRLGKSPAGPVSVPSAEAIVMMVRGALAGVSQANFTENYSVLHGMTTPTLQARVSAAQFGAAFASLRKQKLDLSPILVLLPQFTVAPAVTPQGVLKLVGFFPSRPLQINFDIDYRPMDGFWMIDSLSVSAVPPTHTFAERVAPTTTGSATPDEPEPTLAKSRDWQPGLSAVVFGQSMKYADNPKR